MILNDVANGADFFIETAPALHAEFLGHGDLYIPDVIAIPDRLEKRIGEAEVQEILHGFLAQIVIDAKDRCLVENFMQSGIQRLRALKVAAEGLLDDDSRVVRASGFCEALHHAREQARGNGEVMDGASR